MLEDCFHWPFLCASGVWQRSQDEARHIPDGWIIEDLQSSQPLNGKWKGKVVNLSLVNLWSPTVVIVYSPKVQKKSWILILPVFDKFPNQKYPIIWGATVLLLFVSQEFLAPKHRYLPVPPTVTGVEYIMHCISACIFCTQSFQPLNGKWEGKVLSPSLVGFGL